jgi:NADH-quinone oxidoreductase subunit M
LFLWLSIIGVLYGAFAAWAQNDFKRLIAYSSFSHVNFILAGLFIWAEPAHLGAYLQVFNHGITIAALFLVSDWLEKKLHSTAIGQMGGLAKYLPKLCWLTSFFVLANVALPGLNNFVGELLILFGLFKENPWMATLLGTIVILSVIYMLRMMQKLYFETPRAYGQETWKDLSVPQFALALPLIILILWFGIYPAPIIKQLEPSTKTELNP